MVKLSIVTLLMVLSFSVGQDGTEITSYKLYRGDHRNLQATGDNPIIRYEGLGTHYFDLFVGNPAQKRTLAVTTNSDYTAFACEVRSRRFFLAFGNCCLPLHLNLIF